MRMWDVNYLFFHWYILYHVIFAPQIVLTCWGWSVLWPGSSLQRSKAGLTFINTCKLNTSRLLSSPSHLVTDPSLAGTDIPLGFPLSRLGTHLHFLQPEDYSAVNVFHPIVSLIFSLNWFPLIWDLWPNPSLSDVSIAFLEVFPTQRQSCFDRSLKPSGSLGFSFISKVSMGNF